MERTKEILERALKDPRIEYLECIAPAYKHQVERIVKEMPSDSYVSEWNRGMGNIIYSYHLHNNQMGSLLNESFYIGIKWGHPKLIAVHSREELKEIVQKFSVADINQERQDFVDDLVNLNLTPEQRKIAKRVMDPSEYLVLTYHPSLGRLLPKIVDKSERKIYMGDSYPKIIQELSYLQI